MQNNHPRHANSCEALKYHTKRLQFQNIVHPFSPNYIYANYYRLLGVLNLSIFF